MDRGETRQVARIYLADTVEQDKPESFKELADDREEAILSLANMGYWPENGEAEVPPAVIPLGRDMSASDGTFVGGNVYATVQNTFKDNGDEDPEIKSVEVRYWIVPDNGIGGDPETETTQFSVPSGDGEGEVAVTAVEYPGQFRERFDVDTITNPRHPVNLNREYDLDPNNPETQEQMHNIRAWMGIETLDILKTHQTLQNGI